MAKWNIDPAHSEVGFKVKHLVVSTVSGHFKSFDATVETASGDFSDAVISFSADVDSINTGNEQRDGHLKSPDFFDAASYPKLSFASSGITKKNNTDYLVKGNLTIRGVTKSIELHVEYGGSMTDAYGREVAGFEITGKISRHEFGLKWNGVTEAGSIVVSDDVKLHINAELIKQG